MQTSDRVLVIACGALAREITALKCASGWSALDVTCLPPELHNRPEKIPAAVCAAIREARPRYARIFVAYADCGTGGALDRMLAEEGVERLVIAGLGIDRHPQLAGEYFRHYRRVVYLAQVADTQLAIQARAIAARLGLDYEQRATGYGDLERSLTRVVRGPGVHPPA